MLPKNHGVVADMTGLHHIHEAGILHNLKERSRPWRQTPYTWMVSQSIERTTMKCRECQLGDPDPVHFDGEAID